jgi:hypothetical protein
MSGRVDRLHNASQLEQPSISRQPNRKFEWDNNASHRCPSTLALGFSQTQVVNIRQAFIEPHAEQTAHK